MPSESDHLDEPVFSAADFLAYQRARGLLPEFTPPESIILAFQQELMEYAARNYRVRRFRLFGGELNLFRDINNRVGLIGRFGAGSPAAAAVVDQLVAFGVQRFVSIGLAGGLQPDLETGSLVLATSAIRGEGVSRHYLPSHPAIDTTEPITRGISEILTKNNHAHALGTIWTTDAPFRERRRDVLEYQKQGVLAVEMEAAGLLAVASSAGRAAATVFSIADQLSDARWRMAGDLRLAHRGLSILFENVYEYLALKYK